MLPQSGHGISSTASLLLHRLRTQIQENPRIFLFDLPASLLTSVGHKLCCYKVPNCALSNSCSQKKPGFFFHDIAKTNLYAMRRIQILLTHFKCAASHNLFSTQGPLRGMMCKVVTCALLKRLTLVHNRALSL